MIIETFISKKCSLLFLATLGGAFFAMNIFEPLRCDDLIYQFYWLEERTIDKLEPIDLNNRIDGFQEAFKSQVNHYRVMNGRFVIHFLVSCFCGFWGRSLFSVINAVVYVLFLRGCIMFLNLKYSWDSIIVMAILWLGLPIQYILWYSISFAINYLWTSTFLIYYLILLRKMISCEIEFTNRITLIIVVISIIFGIMHEAFSLPMSGALVLYFFLKRKNICRSFVYMTCGVLIGTIFVSLAPGTIGRGSGALSNIDYSELLLMKLDVFRYSKRFFAFLSFLLYIGFVNHIKFKSFVNEYLIEISFVVLSFLLVLALPHYSQRMEFPLEFLSLLLFLDLLLRSMTNINLKKYLCLIILIIAYIHIPFTIYYANLTSLEYKVMLHEYLESSIGKTKYKNVVIPKPFSSYVHRLDSDVEKQYISFVFQKEMIIDD